MASVINILDLVEEIGIEATDAILADFSTCPSGSEKSLNEDIEVFLKKNSIQFAREKKSVTYLVVDEDDGSLLGYFTIAHKAIEVPASGFSKTKIRTQERYAQLHKEINAYLVSVFLIAQFGKNYGVDDGKRITGDELMKMVSRELCDIQRRVGGGLKYLDCEADVKLMDFYQNKQKFQLCGERISEKDGKRYLQYLKFF